MLPPVDKRKKIVVDVGSGDSNKIKKENVDQGLHGEFNLDIKIPPAQPTIDDSNSPTVPDAPLHFSGKLPPRIGMRQNSVKAPPHKMGAMFKQHSVNIDDYN